jgi:hypothetical protein
LPKANRIILVAESDLHGGSRFGLLNPDTRLRSPLGKEYKPTLSDTQEYLWEVREWGKKEVLKFAEKSPIVLLQVGDVNQGMIYDVDNSLRSQVQIAFMNVQPWLDTKKVVALRVDEGTASHSFGNGSAEQLLVDFVKERYPNVSASVVSHGLSNIGGLKVDHAHHGPHYGIREWTRGNVALYYLRDIMMKDILRGRKPPDLVLRGHFHSVVEVFHRLSGKDNKVHRSWLWVLPSLCGMNGHALKVTQSEYEIINGIIAFEILDGRLRDTLELTKMLDLREMETIL